MPGDASFRSTEGFKAPVKGLYSVKRIPLKVEAAVISGIICANDALPKPHDLKPWLEGSES